MKNRKVQYYNDNSDIKWCYYTSLKNPCGCGSNCYHHELDKETIIGVCNSCGEDIYEIKAEYTNENLGVGTWK